MAISEFDLNLSQPFFSEPILSANRMFPAYPAGMANLSPINRGLRTDTFQSLNHVKPKSNFKQFLIAAGTAIAGFLGFKGGSKLITKFIK